MHGSIEKGGTLYVAAAKPQGRGVFGRTKLRVSRIGVQHALPLVAIGLRCLSASTVDLSYILLGVYGTLGRANVFIAYFLLWVFNMLSEGIGPAPASSVSRYAVLALVSASIVIRAASRSRKVLSSGTVAHTSFLGGFLFLHSLFFSLSPEISILKSLLFFTVFAGLVVTAVDSSARELREGIHVIYFGLVLILLVSFPTALTGLGYLRNGTGLQGVLAHPQIFGPAMALMVGWAVARALTNRGNPLFDVLIAILGLVAVYLSEARTAGAALFLSLALAIIDQLLWRGNQFGKGPRVNRGRVAKLVIGILLAAVVSGTLFDRVVVNYATKSGRREAKGAVEAFGDSRGGLVAMMMENIWARPLVGIGFGIASDLSSVEVERDPYLGLPLSTPNEKGVLPIAVLEEVGVIGFCVVGIWAVSIFVLTRRRSITGLVLLLITVLVNCGESMFFSPNGMGMLFMLVTALFMTGLCNDDAAI